MYCPKCLSDEISRISNETIIYDTREAKVIKIKFDSEYQSYVCRDCEHTFDNVEAKTIFNQISSVWMYLCEKYNWSDQDKEYLDELRKFTRTQWDMLFKHIQKENLGEGYVEWEWSLTYTVCIYSQTSDGAHSFMESQHNPMQSLGLDKVRWSTNWEWIQTKEIEEVKNNE